MGNPPQGLIPRVSHREPLGEFLGRNRLHRAPWWRNRLALPTFRIVATRVTVSLGTRTSASTHAEGSLFFKNRHCSVQIVFEHSMLQRGVFARGGHRLATAGRGRAVPSAGVGRWRTPTLIAAPALALPTTFPE